MGTSGAGRGRALVAGAGIGGLAAAAALSSRFGEVLVFEKDDLPNAAIYRKGAPQGAHVHALLRGGEASLDALLPGVRDDFLAEGAVLSRIGLDYRVFEFDAWRARRDLGSTIVCLTRPAYERALRRRIDALGNVAIVAEARVERVVFQSSAAVGLAVKRGAAGAAIERGDLIVDARGRGAPLVSEMTEEGWPAPLLETIGIGVSYATGIFSSDSGDAEILGYLPTPPEDRYALLFPIEGGRFIATLAGVGACVPPTDQRGFIEFAGSLAAPEIHERLASARLLEPIRAYRKPTADWRRFEAMARFPQRLAPVGDTIASFNPVYGQGMTVAARHALALGAALDRSERDDEGFARAYFEEALKATTDAWSFASAIDFFHPQVEGRRPPDLRMQQAIRFGLRWLADEDEAVHRLVLDVSQMVRPVSDLKNLALAARALAIARRRGFEPSG